MVHVDQLAAKGVRIGVLEERLHEGHVVLLRQNAEVAHDRSAYRNKDAVSK